MINGFEEETHELTAKEKELLPLLVAGLRGKIGKDNQITNEEIRSKLKYNKGLSVPAVRVRKLINYIRTKQLITNLVSDNKGYFIATDEITVINYVESLTQRINEITRVRDSFGID